MTTPRDLDTDGWRESLVALGFGDDGERLRGPVPWTDPTAGAVTARVAITPEETFPFAPPRIVVLDAGLPLEATFHVNSDGSLCAWENDWAVHEAPWRDPHALLRRIADWLQNTASGWPNDDTCDLERYLDQDEQLVLYDATKLAPDRAVRTTPGLVPATIIVSAEQRNVDDIVGRTSGQRKKRGKSKANDRGRRSSKNRGLAWIADIGPVDRPMRAWTDVAAALGTRALEVRRLIRRGVVTLLLMRYSRGRTSSMLAVRVRPIGEDILVTACESADTSQQTRRMRAGRAAPALAKVKIAIVGCGAIGSFAADMLFRSGVRQLTLRDRERLRPGNIVRHRAGTEHVGLPKTHAVADCLSRIDADVSGVAMSVEPLLRLEDAINLVRDHDVILDATGNARASSLLATAAETVGGSLGHTVVSACVQRDGDIVRVDRLPLRNTETYLPALPPLDDSTHPRERGCGSPISPTPPGAVIAAAELAHRVVIDEATGTRSLPATMAAVRAGQPEAPYDHIGLVTSDNAALRTRAVT